MNDTLDILMFFFWKLTKSFQTVSKTVWNCNRDNIIVPGQAFGQKPAVWILQMLHQLIGLFSAHLKLQNDGPSKHLANTG